MLDLNSITIGVLFVIALVFILGASHKKGDSPSGYVSAICNSQQ